VLSQRVQEALAYAIVRCLIHRNEPNDEFVPAKSYDNVGGPEGRFRYSSDSDEGAIADFISEFVVDPLHPIYVDERERDVVPYAARQLKLFVCDHQKATPIVKDGQHEAMAFSCMADYAHEQRAVDRTLDQPVLRTFAQRKLFVVDGAVDHYGQPPAGVGLER
jgi:hypothetical protein